MKKIISLIIVVTMVFAMGAWTYEGASAEIENELRHYGFTRSEDETVWTLDYMDADEYGSYDSDFDYAIAKYVYNSENDFLVVTIVGVNIERNMVKVIGIYAGSWADAMDNAEENMFVWEDEDYM